jgi:hypothetical protein
MPLKCGYTAEQDASYDSGINNKTMLDKLEVKRGNNRAEDHNRGRIENKCSKSKTVIQTIEENQEVNR